MWLPLPLAMLCTAAVVATDRITIPRLLLRGRYASFVGLTFLMAFISLFGSLLFEDLICAHYGVETRVNDWTSPWIAVERFCTSMALTLMLLGIGGVRLYSIWRREAARESAIAATLSEYLRIVRKRLDPESIMDRLRALERSLDGPYEEFAADLGSLSDYLRHQLYELPAPPDVERVECRSDHQRIAEFMTSPVRRGARILIFEEILFVISFASCLVYPDRPDFSLWSVLTAGIVFLVLNVIAALNRWFFKRRFPKHDSPARYLMELSLAILLLVLMFAAVVLSGKESPESTMEPFWILIAAMVGSVINLVLFNAGLSALFVFRHWMAGRQRMAMLSAETARQEYLFLRKQINPHFLFNILNGIGILAIDGRREASEMLVGLRRLMEYQFRESTEETATLEAEVRFLESYMALEKMRADNLAFRFNCDLVAADDRIPTLLLIPVVENAVKHSAGVTGERIIEINMKSDGGNLTFECGNCFSRHVRELRKTGRQGGGLGIANLRRRLSLLYGSRVRLRIKETENHYKVVMDIPLNRNFY